MGTTTWGKALIAALALGVGLVIGLLLRGPASDERTPPRPMTAAALDPEETPYSTPRIAGHVVDRHGRGHRDVLIEATIRRTRVATSTNSAGRFTLDGIDRRRVDTLALTVPGTGPAVSFWVKPIPQDGSALRIVFDQSVRITGSVHPWPREDRTVEVVRMVGGGTARQENTELDGTFDISRLAPDVNYTFSIWVSDEGWREVGTAQAGDRDIVLDIDG